MAASKHIAHTLLLNAHTPEAASTIFTEKVLHKPLRLRPTSPDPTSQNARAQRRRQRLLKKKQSRRAQKPKPLSAKKKRISGIYDIPENAQKYDIYVPLHNMWVGYVWEILGMTAGKGAYLTAQNAGIKLATADYHGAEVMVVRSRCNSLVGLAGIVVRDTKFTFQVITKRDELKTIPKKHTLFQFELPQPTVPDEAIQPQSETSPKAQPDRSLQALVFEIHGSQFENRATDRATKKFKQRHLRDL